MNRDCNVENLMFFFLIIIIGLLFAYEYSIKEVYGEWKIDDWGTVEGEKVIDSLADIQGEDVIIEGNTITVTPENIDPKIYIDSIDNMQYVQINVTSIDTARDVFLRYYYEYNGNYSDSYSESKKLKEGNNIIWFDRPLEGRLRIDFEGVESVSIHIKYIKLDNDVQVVSEFIVCYFLVLLLLSLIGIVFLNYKRIINFFDENYLETIIVSVFFICFLVWSLILPYNSGPDEYMRYDVVKYIYQLRDLPRGDDPILCTANSWGLSYAYSPYLAYLIGACFVYVAAFMGHTGFTMFHFARLVSVLSSTVTIIFMIKISKELKFKNKYILPILVGFLPEFTFISAYVNNDALAIMSVSIIVYAWLVGLKNKWDCKSCIYLIIGMAICVAAYYNCYGYLLLSIVGFIGSYMYWIIRHKKPDLLKDMLVKGVLLTLGTFIISGWWFVRNYILYNGDIFGSSASRTAAIKYAATELNPLNKHSLKEQGVSLYEMLFERGWIIGSAKSFVASFGYLQFWIKDYMYKIVGIILVIGLVLKIISVFKKHERRMLFFDALLIMAAIIVVVLSIVYSYTSDYQAQGRYVLPMLVPLMIFVCQGYDQLDYDKYRFIIPILMVITIWINMYSLGLVIIPSYYW